MFQFPLQEVLREYPAKICHWEWFWDWSLVDVRKWRFGWHNSRVLVHPYIYWTVENIDPKRSMLLFLIAIHLIFSKNLNELWSKMNVLVNFSSKCSYKQKHCKRQFHIRILVIQNVLITSKRFDESYKFEHWKSQNN